jgi:hypothetical protein
MVYGLFQVSDAMPRGIALSSSGFTVQVENACYLSSALSWKVMFCYALHTLGKRYSSVGIVTRYGLFCPGFESLPERDVFS